MKEYPKWKSLINEYPSEQDFNEAWKHIFGFYPKECSILNKVDFGSNKGFEVQTPEGMYLHGGFGFKTDTPITEEDIFQQSGCTWSVDDNGDRYYRIDKETMLPRKWNDVKAIEIISNFLKNKFGYKRQLPENVLLKAN